MSKFFYAKLAWNNLKSNSRTYLPYILTCISAIAMFYIMMSLAHNPSVGDGTMAVVLRLGVIVMAIFSILFLFYTNSFLMKRRKQEFALYNILGMEKKHIAKIITIENIYTYIIGIVVGLAVGILLSKLVELVLLKLLSFDIRFGFHISFIGIGAVLVLFTIIFVILLLSSLLQIRLSNPIQLLKAASSGEKEPKTKWLLAVIGAICLLGGYYISVATEDPIAVIMLFFLAVILVIIGTYLLFISGSIALLKGLRKNKNYYYKPKHFISISGMMYRMKQNAAGLATICILSTMVLVMISSTASLFFGMEDSIHSRYPKEISIKNYNYTEENRAIIENTVAETLAENGQEVHDVLSYRVASFTATRQGSEFNAEEYRGSYEYYNICLIPLEDFTVFSGINTELNPQEALLFTTRTVYGEDTLSLLGYTFQVNEAYEEFSGFSLSGSYNADIAPTYYLIVKDMSIIEAVCSTYAESFEYTNATVSFFYGFELAEELDDEQKMLLTDQVTDALYSNNLLEAHIESRAVNRATFLELYGGLFFLGIFLGLVFIMATVLIIYYKQVSEGYDDKGRFAIMQKVGLSKKEAKRTIRSQILTMFFLPLITACIHLLFAFPALARMLEVLNLTNVNLFITTTLLSIALFTVFYIIVYSLTAKTYYKIVNNSVYNSNEWRG